MNDWKEKLMRLYRAHRETLLYLIFGGMTTVLSFALYYVFLFCGMHYIAAQILSWIGAVIFAYVTNRIWVFESRSRGFLPVLREFVSFVAVRLFSGVVETVLLWLMVDIAGIAEGIAKIPVAVLTVVLNYITGKLIVFRKK